MTDGRRRGARPDSVYSGLRTLLGAPLEVGDILRLLLDPVLRVGELVLLLALALLAAALARSDPSPVTSPAAFFARPVILSMMLMGRTYPAWTAGNAYSFRPREQ